MRNLYEHLLAKQVKAQGTPRQLRSVNRDMQHLSSHPSNKHVPNASCVPGTVQTLGCSRDETEKVSVITEQRTHQ